MSDPSALAPRSVLRLRARPHLHPDRGGETIVEVVREGEVVALIYGSREGIHITLANSATMPRRAIQTDVRGGAPGLLVPLLRPDEPCPWCGGEKKIEAGVGLSMDCPICATNQKET